MNAWKAWGILALAFGCLASMPGCQDYSFEQVVPIIIAQKRWEKTISVAQAADILFIVDNSGSMAGEQRQLGESFREFASALDLKFGKNYHIAVVTTGMVSHQCPACCLGLDLGCGNKIVDQSCIQPSGEDGLFQYRLGKNIGTDDDPDYRFETNSDCRVVNSESKSCFYDHDPASGRYQSGTALVGFTGCGFERGLEAMRNALTDERLSKDNSGFLRKDADLVVVVISDEEDCGKVGDVYEGSNADLCYFASKGVGPEATTYFPGDLQKLTYHLEPVESYLDFLLSKKKWPNEVKFAAIVGMSDKADSSTTTIEYRKGSGGWSVDPVCVTPRSVTDKICDEGHPCSERNEKCFAGRCVIDLSLAYPGTRYIQLAQRFGKNGFLDTICQDDFSETMKNLGTFVGCETVFPLTEGILDPVLANILVNGEEVPRYACNVKGPVEVCHGLDDASCSKGACQETWIYCPAEGSPDPDCPPPRPDEAPGGIITFRSFFDACTLAKDGVVNMEFVYATDERPKDGG